MAADRLLRILAKLAAEADVTPSAPRLCEVCADVSGLSGAGIMLMAGDDVQGSLCSSNNVSKIIEDLQYTLGEGPCLDAYRQDRPVFEPDLGNPSTPRWLAFTPSAAEAGARAIFGFPLQVGAVRLGALNLWRDQPGPLTDDQHADALVLAGVVAQAVLAIQAQLPAGALAVEQSGADFRFVVHQASGMVAAQLGVSVGEALIRLRGHAFANGQPITDVAEAVVARRLRFDTTPEGKDDGEKS